MNKSKFYSQQNLKDFLSLKNKSVNKAKFLVNIDKKIYLYVLKKEGKKNNYHFEINTEKGIGKLKPIFQEKSTNYLESLEKVDTFLKKKKLIVLPKDEWFFILKEDIDLNKDIKINTSKKEKEKFNNFLSSNSQTEENATEELSIMDYKVFYIKNKKTFWETANWEIFEFSQTLLDILIEYFKIQPDSYIKGQENNPIIALWELKGELDGGKFTMFLQEEKEEENKYENVSMKMFSDIFSLCSLKDLRISEPKLRVWFWKKIKGKLQKLIIE